MPKRLSKRFPKVIFVKIDKIDDIEEYFLASDDMYGLCEMGEKIKIATYQLVETTVAEVVLQASALHKPKR